MIRGSAFDTTVEARIDTNMPTIRPERAWSTSRRDIRAGAPDSTSRRACEPARQALPGETRPRDGPCGHGSSYLTVGVSCAGGPVGRPTKLTRPRRSEGTRSAPWEIRGCGQSRAHAAADVRRGASPVAPRSAGPGLGYARVGSGRRPGWLSGAGAAQALAAAGAEPTSDRWPSSVHAYFVRAGRSARADRVRVDRSTHADGRAPIRTCASGR